MPIRLLHIVLSESESDLKIRLLEREGVYTHLAAQIKVNYSEAVFLAKLQAKCVEWPHFPDAAEKEVIKDWVSQYAKYAILSHTWIRAAEGEVTYSDWHRGAFNDQQLGYLKLVSFCKAAWQHHKLAFCWMDTVGIDKDSSSELDESIRSMYKWYQNSAICITYLADTRKIADMQEDHWFTRGWTFQEMLAPHRIKFYNIHWERLTQSFDNDKLNSNIQAQILQATTITHSELLYPHIMPISRKMQLAAKRFVMREEDIAYSLMGICDVSISIAYGEGAQRAFSRLMTQILHSSSYVLDVFNCTEVSSSLIPSTPSAYIQRSTKVDGWNFQKPIEPLLLTHLGLRIPILLMPSLQEDDPRFQNVSMGAYHATVDFPKQWFIEHTGAFHLLDKGLWVPKWTWTLSRTSTTDANSNRTYNMIFGILNFGGDKTDIEVPTTCLAVAFWAPWNVELEPTSASVDRYRTQEPIVFDLRERSTPSTNHVDHPSSHSIKQSELAVHGMKIVTMYL